jgi:hypothetical protein
VHRSAIALLLLFAATNGQAATTYRTTITTRDRFKQPPVVQRITVDGENRLLKVENQDEPFSYDALLSADGGRTVTALNTPLRTWFELPKPWVTATGMPPSIPTEIKDAKTSVTEEPADETIAGFPIRKFVIRVSYTSREDYGSTKVNRLCTMTTIVWTTDKLDRSLAFPMPVITMGIESLDAELRAKSAVIPGFPLRSVRTVSRAYEGGAPEVEITRVEVDDIRTVPPPRASALVKPAGYVHQAPVIGVPGK